MSDKTNVPVPEGFEKLIAERNADPYKIHLTCKTHGYIYGVRGSYPNFRCKECSMVSFWGLMGNTQPEKRLEVMEMLEYTTNKLIEAHQKGHLNVKAIMEAPIVQIHRDGEKIFDSENPVKKAN